MTRKELKKEAEEYADNINGLELTCSLLAAKDKNHVYRLGRYEGYLASAEPREKRIEELEKENAELKRIVKMVAMINKGVYTNEGIKAIYAEAEQFLSEVEK